MSELNFETKIISKSVDSNNRIRLFNFTSKITHPDYPDVHTYTGGEPLVDLPHDADLPQWVIDRFSEDPVFIQHVNETLSFEQIKHDSAKEYASAEEMRESMPQLTSRQFWLAAFSVGITKQDILDACGDDEQLKVIVTESTNFFRLDDSVVLLSPLLGVSEEELDDLWMWAAGSPSDPIY